MTDPTPALARATAPPPGPWLARRAAAAIAAALGAISFVVVAIGQGDVWATPDWRLSVPGFAATLIASIASIARREPAFWLWGLGLALAAASIVLGWFLMVAIIIGAAAVLILILHALM